MSDNEAVSWSEVAPHIWRIALHRPPANALGLPIVDGLARALDAADAAGDVKVVIIASDITGIFAAGADIKLMATIGRDDFEHYGDALRAVVNRLASPDRLSIAAVEGLALGGGLELSLGAHFRVAGRNAAFGLPEVTIGLIPGAGGTQRLPQIVGRGRALDIILTGRQLDAEEARSIGLISRLVDAGNAFDAALELATQLLKASSRAQSAAIRAVAAAYDLPGGEGHTVERHEVGEQLLNGDGREGLAAFVEKRRPRFP